MRTLHILITLLSVFAMTATAKTKQYIVTSPDKRMTLTAGMNNGHWTYSLTRDGRKLIDSSAFGLYSESGVLMPSALSKAGKAIKKSHKGVWKPVWGKRSVVRDRYNEITLPFVDELSVVFRLYDDGMAFRYVLYGTGRELAEQTEFRFAGDYNAWYYNGERHNIGPERLSAADGERLPVMTIDAGGCFMAVHEADLEDVAPMTLHSKAGERLFTVGGGGTSVGINGGGIHSPSKSAWRVVMCADKIGTLVDSHILELLCPESMPGLDFSWVKPGVCLWDWRIDGAVWDGFEYTMSYPSWVRMVDFAAKQGFRHLVLDANWYGPEFEKNSDPVKGDKAKDVCRLIKYAADKGVGIWLYLNDVGGKNYPIAETLRQYHEWGAAGVKYGFMTGDAKEKNRKTREITALCAMNRLLVDFHDYPIHPYGQMRTWPNAVTREYCKAQLDGHDIFYPKTFVTSVFVNMLAGPIDQNNGMFDLRQGKTTRKDNNQEVPSTVVAEAARTQITFSGATIIPDIPEYYEKHPSLLRFLSAQKMPWRESRTLDGRIGEYIVMMRRAADGAYLVGAATDENRRTIDIPLDFLPKGSYHVEITEDGDNADYLTNRETTKVSHKDVTSKDTITVRLAPGGGACLLITQKTK
ncbi:glycoside hydrolase family 97 protein [Prevotella sp. PINT]|jgi:Glycoside hydrolase 97.|uniref:glycoside hydrolase family 97 protein n=1 Tax=Palleniella intestinalis TaxID=2736291 RepID=UPI0015564CAB|nr:glycoside hydrolase family 97 protein [Palleniella intestinalis]NPD82632.1 glycoside hydrolase family 97 protein [Palleniella intestinalis]